MVTRPQRSRTAESFDPEPMRGPLAGTHHQRDADHSCAEWRCSSAPRPYFEPTRDPLAWEFVSGRRAFTSSFHARSVPPGYRWDPRPEYTAEVNPILVAFRSIEQETPNSAAYYLDSMEANADLFARDFAPHHIDFARRVLSKLAALS